MIRLLGRPIGLLVPAVDGQPGPVVLQHGPDDLRPAGCLAKLGVVLLTHGRRVAAVPGVRVGVDHPLRDLGLGEEEPVPPPGGEPGVGAGQVLTDRDAVQQSQPGDQGRVVEGEPQRDVAAAVVPGQGEPVVPEPLHQPGQVAGHRPLGVG